MEDPTNEAWDAHYQAICYDPWMDRVHVAYTVHRHESCSGGSFERRKVMYVWTDDDGAHWYDADGTLVNPSGSFLATAYQTGGGGTEISTEDWEESGDSFFGNSIAVTPDGENASDVHFLYWEHDTDSGLAAAQHYVRIDGATGAEESRQRLFSNGRAMDFHAAFAVDLQVETDYSDDILYIFSDKGGANDNESFVLASYDGGDTWIPLSRTGPDYDAVSFNTVYPSVVDGSVIGMATRDQELWIGNDMVVVSSVVFARHSVLPFVFDPDPGIAGQNNTFAVSRVAPGESVRLYYSLSLGSDTDETFGNCTDVPLSLNNAGIVMTATADDCGVASATVSVNANASGQTLYFQAVDSRCRVSEVVAFEFP